jgi:AmmeMemoRadiSam system radical SAM enzyme/AmmeMemoRadiSam system protein B/AmmeMemoRadiSam system protein A
MTRRTILPPDEPATPQGIKPGGWWHDAEDGKRVVCDLCPRGCALGEGDRGFCFVRQNLGGRIVSTTYGRSTGFCIDPIEKKPLNQFYPGTAVLSFGTAGCNLGCKFCQNWESSKSREIDAMVESADPETVAEAARQLGCRSVAFTYNDPVIWAEYAIDTARACHAVGVKTVAVTAGYITPQARTTFYEHMDAANVDLKGFSEDFYWKLTSGHLDPVRDTLRWLARETDVWLEVTNLIIPQANDGRDELQRMCQWMLEALGPDVPVHFTAFHPDFRMRDLPPTPPQTLAMAHDIARRAGLRYVYTGNISDQQRQSTFCPGCGRMVVQRDGYHLGLYALDGNRCRHCSTQLAGRFDASGPGSWGPRRQPVRIAQYARPKTARVQPPVEKTQQGAKTMESQPVKSAPVARDPGQPQLDASQDKIVFEAAGRRVAAAVRGEPPERLDDVLGPLAATPVLGSFVSLKRGGQLRSCCGFLGTTVPLYQALDHASVRAAKDDPRFPPISPTELDHLDLEVWLLWGMEPVAARGQARRDVVVIGRHGLQIARGNNRGLLLPGVAIEHNFDAETFLQQVCRKAGLPGDAWLADDTQLWTFQGRAIHGTLKSCLPKALAHVVPGGPSYAEVAMLADVCRQNLVALLMGATPTYYVPAAYDGAVAGVTMSVYVGNADRIDCGQIGMRPEMPLQSSLFELTKSAAGALAQSRFHHSALNTARVGLTVLWDPAMHGAGDQPQWEGVDPRHRAVLVLDRGHWAMAYNPQSTPDGLLAEAAKLGRMTDLSRAAVCSMAAVSSDTQAAMTNVPRPQAGAEVRQPAVAGRFYPGTVAEVDQMLAEMIPAQRQPESWAGVMVPHAGWIYSGKLAARVLSRVKIPKQVLIISPKHNRDGADWAIAPHRTWSLPGCCLESDVELARTLAQSVAGLELDAAAHAREHAIEVQLPILARLAPDARVVGIAMHGGDLDSLRRMANQLAGALAKLPELPLLVISSDMNHYADDRHTRTVDRLALDAMRALDTERLFNTVEEKRISMCGIVPAVVVMETLRCLKRLNRCEEVGYATSAEASGDTQRVVGYAGMLFA